MSKKCIYVHVLAPQLSGSDDSMWCLFGGSSDCLRKELHQLDFNKVSYYCVLCKYALWLVHYVTSLHNDICMYIIPSNGKNTNLRTWHVGDHSE